MTLELGVTTSTPKAKLAPLRGKKNPGLVPSPPTKARDRKKLAGGRLRTGRSRVHAAAASTSTTATAAASTARKNKGRPPVAPVGPPTATPLRVPTIDLSLDGGLGGAGSGAGGAGAGAGPLAMRKPRGSRARRLRAQVAQSRGVGAGNGAL